MTTILVTGATGTIGKATLAALAAQPGATVRAAVRKASFGKVQKTANITPVELDWENPATFGPALAGVERAFLITPVAPNGDELARAFVDAAKQAGVKHIVKLSAAGAEADKPITLLGLHRKAERHLEQSGIGFTHLRPAMFAENLVSFWPPQKDGGIYVPFGDGKIAYIDSVDVGACAAAVLLAPEKHAGKAYILTGPRAVGTAEAAALIGTATGRPTKYVDVPESAAREAMLGMNMPVWMVDGLGELYALAKAGRLGDVTRSVEEITGTPATRLEDFVAAHKAAWI